MSDTVVLLVCEQMRACRACLATDVQLVALRPGHLADMYAELSGIQVLPSDGLPQHMCSMCAALLRKSVAFRDKCRNTHDFLQGVGKQLQQQPISMSLIRHLDRKYLKLPYSTTDVLTVSILEEVTNPKEYEIPVKQETQIEFVKEESEDDCVVIEDCKDNYIMVEVEPIELSKKEEIFTDINIIETENASSIANNDNAVPKLKRKRVEVSVKNKKIEKCLIKSKEESTDIHKRLFCNYVLDKYFYKTKQSSGTDEYDIFDSNAEKKDTIIKTVDNSFDACVISAKGNTLIDDAELNKNMFFDYIREKYVNKKDKNEMRKIVNRTKLRIKNLKCNERSRTENDRNIQESRSIGDVEFAKLYNFDVIRMTRSEQILELERSRKKAYQQLKFKCEECFRGFSTETLYKKHMPIHDPISGSHVCKVCKQRFLTKRKLYNHRIRHRTKYVCRQCKQTFSEMSKARDHHKIHAGNSYDYECPHCGVLFRKNASRMSHIQKHHGATQCDICYGGFQGARGLMQHKMKSHEQTYQCASCDVHFDNAHAMLRHIGPSPGGACDPNVRACAKCGERFDTDEEFNEHVAELHARAREKQREQQRQIQKTKNKCCTCPKFEHGENVDGGHKGVTLCNEYVPNSDNVPTGDLCPCSSNGGDECLCPKGSVRSCKLTEPGDHTDKVDRILRYKWTHKGCCNGRRLLSSHVMCEVCGNDYVNQAALRVHQRVHTGEKPFQCNECSKRFRHKQSLQIHIYTHTGERPYKCSLCPKTFNNYINRRRHRLVHTKERRYRCEVCDKMFLTSTCVKTHVRTVHMKIPQPPRVRNRKRKCEWAESE